MNSQPLELVRELGLQPHPEGGYFRATYRADARDANGRAASTLIYFLLMHGQVSADRKFKPPVQADPCSRNRPDGEREPAVDRPCPANPAARKPRRPPMPRPAPRFRPSAPLT